MPVIVDPKVPHIDYYAGAALVTPNHVEAESATNTRISATRMRAARRSALRQRIGVESVLITRGEHGMWLDHAGAGRLLPASAREVADVTGAGDTVIATLALAIAAGATMFEAARLANEAASIVVGKFGPPRYRPGIRRFQADWRYRLSTSSRGGSIETKAGHQQPNRSRESQERRESRRPPRAA